MIPDIDTWRGANVMMKRYGKDAAFEAAQRAEALFEKGDTGGIATWQRTARAIKEM